MSEDTNMGTMEVPKPDGNKVSWFTTGYEGLDTIQASDKSAASPRFWLPRGAEKKVTFVDSEPFCFWEVNLNLNGSWRNWFTSLKSLNQECPLEKAGFKPYYVGMFTIIEHTPWTDSKGVEHKDNVKLFPAKTSTLKRLRRQVDKNGDLKGCTYTIFRTDEDKSPAVGDEYTFIESIEVATLYPEAKVFEYEDLFSPSTKEELAKIVGVSDNVNEVVKSDTDVDVPF